MSSPLKRKLKSTCVFQTAEELRAIEEAMLRLKPFDERVCLTVTGGINRPPLERTPQVVELYESSEEHRWPSWGSNLGRRRLEERPTETFSRRWESLFLMALESMGTAPTQLTNILSIDDIPRRGALLAGLIASL